MLSILLHLLQTCLVLPDCQPRSSPFCSFLLVLKRRSLLVLPYPHIRVQPHAGSHSHLPHKLPLMTQTPACVFTCKNPQAASTGASTPVRGYTGELKSSHRHTLSHLTLRQNCIQINVCACLRMPSLAEIHSISYSSTTQAFTTAQTPYVKPIPIC